MVNIKKKFSKSITYTEKCIFILFKLLLSLTFHHLENNSNANVKLSINFILNVINQNCCNIISFIVGVVSKFDILVSQTSNKQR